MKKRFLAITTVLFALFLSGCETTESLTMKQEPMMQSVEGVIYYRERIALPPEAEVTVTLEDVSRADAASIVIAEQIFTTDGEQVPFDFALSYDANDIKANHRYSVRGKITLNGKLRFTTDTIYPVITDPKNSTSVNLKLIGTR